MIGRYSVHIDPETGEHKASRVEPGKTVPRGAFIEDSSNEQEYDCQIRAKPTPIG